MSDLRLMTFADRALLHSICREAYSQNFGHHWEEGGLPVYLDTVFGEEVLAAELGDPAIVYYVGFVDGLPAGFMKLRLVSNLPGGDPEKGIELDKLYVLPSYKGLGIGGELLALGFRVARELGKEVFWLGVIDTNVDAIVFYEKAGFRKHSRMRVGYAGFREELRGMWRMWVGIG